MINLFNLGQGADWSTNPGDGEHQLGKLGVGQVRDGVHDGVQPVDGDDDHDEAGQVKPENPEKKV